MGMTLSRRGRAGPHETVAPSGVAVALLCLLLLAVPLSAQDLDPRAYASVPINSTLAIAGFSFSRGGVVTDPTLPISNIYAKVATPSVGIARTFGLFGLTGQALAALPYSWAAATGEVNEAAARVTRSGLSDMRLRLSVLLVGGPAMRLEQFVKAARRPIIGASLSAGAPTGQYYSDRLINLGTNRWSFKPEVGLSYPLGSRWSADVYAGMWFFTSNAAFYPGAATKTQNRLGALQAHAIYSWSPKAWAAFDATWYIGGQALVDGVPAGNRYANSRVGATVNLPVGSRHAVKLAWSTGAIIRSGADFTTVSIGWQTGWVDRRAVKR